MEPAKLLLSRRGFLIAGAAGLTSVPLLSSSGTVWEVLRGDLLREELHLSAASDEGGSRHTIRAIDSSGRGVNVIPVGTRCHGMALHPNVSGRAVVYARRPGYLAYEVDARSAAVRHTIQATPGRYFYGHGSYTPDARHLLSTENDVEKGIGVVTIRETKSFSVIGEIPSFGIGPHEVAFLPDKKTLVVANGGYLEDASPERTKRGILEMQPSLSYVDVEEGRLLAQFRLPDRFLSIRHLSVTSGGGVAIALQYEGSADSPQPVVAFHHGEDTPVLGEAPGPVLRQLAGYALSVCADRESGITAVTSPRGDTVTFWNSRSGLHLASHYIRDASGVTISRSPRAFLVSNGFGEIFRVSLPDLIMDRTPVQRDAATKWDNHLSAAFRA